MMSEICDDPGIMNHSEAVGFFNRLIIDLKLRELGESHDAITMERLKKASAHIRDIAECKRHIRVRRALGSEWLRVGGEVEYEVERRLQVEDLPFADDIVEAFEDYFGDMEVAGE